MMNIKSIFSNIVLAPSSRAKVGEKEVKSQGSTDRDADGRRQGPEAEIKRNLTDEEFTQALEKLKEFPGVKSNNLTVRVLTDKGLRNIVIEDPEGRVVRRLSEAQLWASVQQLDKTTGQFFDKAM